MTSYIGKTPHDEPLTIAALLKALGHEPVSIGGDEFQYASVLGNQTNNKIVLTVNNRLNTWFDSSLGPIGKGGNLIEFARTYWPDLSAKQIEEKLRTIQRQIAKDERPLRKRKATKIPHYQIERTGSLGYNKEITDFLMSSGLWELADLNIQEIHYYVTDQKGNRKDFCAAGWQNENGGWEVRAQNYSGCIGPRGMTFIAASETALAIFPEYVDYLKKRSDKYLHYASILILNHSNFISTSLKRAYHFQRVLMYTDETGGDYQSLAEIFKDKVPHAEIIPLC
ncbi:MULTISPECIES: hypothetical protein [Sphingobacterium]|uniref:DUF3991 domain-containing protein n=1 Tax=Sphingobacterium populi TaxID=1812824 RepID=A0ABW5UCJ2_9SPHI|nr:hypothetical protein [Sphingobacterium sp. CFCC 11742]